MIILKGTSFYQKAINALEEWSIGTLKLEPDNPYDEEACAVYVNDDLVGYLPKGWRHEYWGQEVIDYINSPQRNRQVSLRKVGGYIMNNGKTATTGLRLITRADLEEELD